PLPPVSFNMSQRDHKDWAFFFLHSMRFKVIILNSLFLIKLSDKERRLAVIFGQGVWFLVGKMLEFKQNDYKQFN
ncbi:MAG: hypothetical protein Q7J98_09305, partial [Kiritimatiellia bacterium]|nr:hypothetical protein [Kiritimatiellia bacterium]